MSEIQRWTPVDERGCLAMVQEDPLGQYVKHKEHNSIVKQIASANTTLNDEIYRLRTEGTRAAHTLDCVGQLLGIDLAERTPSNVSAEVKRLVNTIAEKDAVIERLRKAFAGERLRSQQLQSQLIDAINDQLQEQADD